MSVQRIAAARRAQIKKMLSERTQADTKHTQREMLELLGNSVSLRTLKRDLQILRERSGTKGSGTATAGGSKRPRREETARVDTTTQQTLNEAMALLDRFAAELAREKARADAWLEIFFAQAAALDEARAERAELRQLRREVAAAQLLDATTTITQH